MNQFKMLDIFLMPRELHGKISDAKWTLIPSVLLIGVADVLSPLTDRLPSFLSGQPGQVPNGNALLTILYIVLFGVIDILFFSIPLFVLFNFFNKDNKITRESATFIKLIKVYALAHLPVIPVNEIIYFAGSRLNPESSRAYIALIAIYFYFIMRFWFAGIISRGINVLYNFKPIHGNLVFVVVFFWNILLGEALAYIYALLT